MHVVQVAPLWFGVGPAGPGGIETFLAALVRALGDEGARVTLIGAGDADVPCRVLPVVDRGLVASMEKGAAWDHVPYEQHALHLAREALAEADVAHCHLGPAGFALDGAPVLHTIHSQVGPDLAWYAARHPGTWLSTVSDYQAARLREAGVERLRVIPNGVDFAGFDPGDGGEGLAFLGRMEAEKGPDLAIAASRALGRPLTLAGPMTDPGFFADRIEPELGDAIAYVGVLGHDEKAALLGRSACVLMPSRWAEPFGLVAVEAMACGTPVAALPAGALPDVVEEGITGAVGEDLASAVLRAEQLDRRAVRARAEERFAIAAVARRYLDVLEEVAA